MGERARWLVSPWFLGAVALLVLNDHVFKAAWPGLITGKLSDFAGVAVVATVAAVLLGRTWGVVLAGVGFAALKTLPGLAEWSAPLMGGGVTLRDHTDLVALLILPPLWLGLGRPAPEDRRTARGWQVLGLVAAVSATTATSALPDEVTQLGFRDGAFYAEVSYHQDRRTEWISSTDGGATWVDASRPWWGLSDSTEFREGPDARNGVDPVTEGFEDCADDGVCYRSIRITTPNPDDPDASDERTYRVERREPGGDWETDVVLTRHGDIAVDDGDSERAVVNVGSALHYREGPDQWTEVDVIEQLR